MAVFDVGRHCIRVGSNAQTAAPKVAVPSLVGRPRQRAHVGMDVPDLFVGVDVTRHRTLCDVTCPLGDGKVESAGDLELLFRQGFQLLGREPEETAVVVTEPVDATKSFRGEVGSVLMRAMRVPAVLFVQQGPAAVFGCGMTSGVSLDVGEHSSRAVAVIDGIAVSSTFARTPIAASCVTDHLHSSLLDQNRGDSGRQPAAGIAGTLKETACFVRSDAEDTTPDLEMQCIRDFQLPDGTTVSLGAPRFMAPEALFDVAAHRDTVVGARAQRLPQIVRDSLLACDQAARDAVGQTIVTSGGTALLRNFDTRLGQALRRDFDLPPATRSSLLLHPSSIAPSIRTWVGAATFSALSSAVDLFTTQEDLAESGLGALGRHLFVE